MCARKQIQRATDKRQPEEPQLEGQPRRMWTPWRMKYIAHETGEDGCVFCNRLARENDTQSLILHRSDHAFVIMNLYPYNTGHVMIVANRHVPDPQELSLDELSCLAALLPVTLTALRRVLNPAGFNVGMNIGAIAGAGVVDHLHQHVVPRWQGDANFMPIIAGAMIIPELIQSTYAKVRAEFERSRLSDAERTVSLIILNGDATRLLVTSKDRLPTVDIKPHKAIFQSAAEYLRSFGLTVDLVGWAGNQSTTRPGRPALAYLSESTPRLGGVARWIPVDKSNKSLAAEVREALNRALELDLTVAAAPPG